MRQLDGLVIVVGQRCSSNWPGVGDRSIKKSRDLIDLCSKARIFDPRLRDRYVKLRSRLVEFGVKRSHSVRIRLSDLLIDEQPKPVIQYSRDSQVLKRFDVVADQVAIPCVDSFH